MENQELIQSLKAAGIELSPDQLKQLNGFSSVITKEMATKSIEKKNLNVEVKDNHVRSTIVTKLAKSESKNRDDYRPSPEQLEKINSMALRELDANEVYVFELNSADMEVDRSYEHFSKKAIDDMAAMAPGTPVFLDHDWSVHSVVGKVFDAKNKKGVLTEWAYFPKTAATESIIENVFNGIINKLSVGFAVDFDQMTCDSCSKSIFDYECDHYPGQKDKSGKDVTVSINRVKELYERSLVGVPCQRGTNIKGIEEAPGVTTKTYLGDSQVDLGKFSEDLQKALDAAFDGPTGGSGFITVTTTDPGSTGPNLEYITTVQGENPTADTIKTGKDTIQDNSVSMEDNKVKEAEALEAPQEEEEPAAPQEEVLEEEKSAEEEPAEESPEAPVVKEEAKAPEIKIELPQEFTKLLGALLESIESLKEDQKAVHKKLDVAMTLSTAGLKSMLAAKEAEEEVDVVSKNRAYVEAKWGAPAKDDLGGQE